MCDRCIAAAREKYALLNLRPQRDPSPRVDAPRSPLAPSRRTARRLMQRDRARRLAEQINA